MMWGMDPCGRRLGPISMRNMLRIDWNVPRHVQTNPIYCYYMSCLVSSNSTSSYVAWPCVSIDDPACSPQTWKQEGERKTHMMLLWGTTMLWGRTMNPKTMDGNLKLALQLLLSRCSFLSSLSGWWEGFAEDQCSFVSVCCVKFW